MCLATPTWEGDYNKSTVQLMSLVASTRRVLYVDYPYTLKDVVSGLLGGRVPVRRILGLERRLRKMDASPPAHLFVYTPPPTLPINWVPLSFLYRILLKVNNWIVMRGTQRTMRTLGMVHPVVVNALNPFYGLYFMQKLAPRKVVYYCYDEISAAPWLSKHGAAAERQFVKKVDAIVTSSAALYQKKLAYGRPCFLVKNGVSFDLFHQYSNAPSDTSPTVVGYVGSLDERIDYALLEYIIRQSPQLPFRFVGRVIATDSVDALRKYDNVVLLPPVAYAEVPKHVSDLAVGIIPFVKNEFTRFIYPLKVNEYLAVGKPVVMTNFTQLQEFAKVAQICDSKESFLRGIHQALLDTDEAMRTERTRVARQNSWEHRTQKFLEVLND